MVLGFMFKHFSIEPCLLLRAEDRSGPNLLGWRQRRGCWPTAHKAPTILFLAPLSCGLSKGGWASSVTGLVTSLPTSLLSPAKCFNGGQSVSPDRHTEHFQRQALHLLKYGAVCGDGRLCFLRVASTVSTALVYTPQNPTLGAQVTGRITKSLSTVLRAQCFPNTPLAHMKHWQEDYQWRPRVLFKIGLAAQGVTHWVTNHRIPCPGVLLG